VLRPPPHHIPFNFIILLITKGHAVEQLFGGTAQRVGKSGVRFPMLSLEFFIDIILQLMGK